MQASPADGHEAAKTGNDARQSIRWIPAFAGSWKRNPLPDPEGAPASPAAPKPGSGRRLFLKTTDPELPALVGHHSFPGRPHGGHRRETLEQSSDEEQRDHGDAET